MKKLTLTLVALLLWASSLEAQIMLKTDKELEVGSNVVGVFGYDPPEYEDYPILNDTISIFCAGVDVNNNGIIDPEDEPASWWKYDTKDTSSSAYKVIDFEYFFKKPYIFALDRDWGAYDVSLTFQGYEEGDETSTYAFGKYIDLENNTLLFKDENKIDNLLHFHQRQGEWLYIKEYPEFDQVSLNGGGKIEDTLKGKFVGFISFFNMRKHPRYGYYESSTYLSILSAKDGELWLEKYGGSGISPATIKKTTTEKIMDFNPETDTITSMTNNFQMIIKSSDANQVKYRFHHNLSENEKLLPYEEEQPTYVARLDVDQYAIVTDDRNIVLKDLYNRKKGDLEMHRSEFEIGYITQTLDYVFVASKHKNEKHTGKVAIYDYINENHFVRPEDSWQYQEWQYVGYQPVATFIDKMSHSSLVHTLCKGIDYNFNGIVEEELGDVAPSLWKSSFETDEEFLPFEKVMDIDFKINLPVRANLSPEGNILIPSGNNLIVFSREEEKTVEVIDLGTYVVSVDAVEFDSNTYYLFGLRDYESGKSYVRVLSQDFTFDKQIETGVNIADARFTNHQSFGNVITVNEGDYEQKNAKIEFFSFDDDGARKQETLYVGGVGSKISMPFVSNMIYVIMTGSHEIHIIKKGQNKVNATLKTDTKGSGGPRDVGFDHRSLLHVSTYSGEIQIYDAQLGHPYPRFDKKGTGFTGDVNSFIYDFIFVDNIMHTYNDPSNRVFLFNGQLTSVDQDFSKFTTPPIRIYPHPVANDFHLVSDELVGELSIAIIDGQGKVVAIHSAVADGEVVLSADELGLGAGNYTAIINGTKAVRFIVIE